MVRPILYATTQPKLLQEKANLLLSITITMLQTDTLVHEKENNSDHLFPKNSFIGGIQTQQEMCYQYQLSR